MLLMTSLSMIVLLHVKSHLKVESGRVIGLTLSMHNPLEEKKVSDGVEKIRWFALIFLQQENNFILDGDLRKEMV
jgi:hypothetical protein